MPKKKPTNIEDDYENYLPRIETKTTVTEADKEESLSKLFCLKNKINPKLVIFFGCCEVLFLAMSLILTIAHFARYSVFVDRMSTVLIVIVVGIFLGILSAIILFVGVNKNTMSFIKLHYTTLAIAPCMLLLSFVFIFTSIYGEFDERYLYGETSPPIMIALGALWCVATPLSLIGFYIVRRYYKILQERNRRIAALKKSNSNQNHLSTLNSSDENRIVQNESSLLTDNEIVEHTVLPITTANYLKNVSPMIMNKFNGSIVNESYVPTIVVCNPSYDDAYELDAVGVSPVSFEVGSEIKRTSKFETENWSVSSCPEDELREKIPSSDEEEDKGLTYKELCEKAESKGIEKETDEKLPFTDDKSLTYKELCEKDEADKLAKKMNGT